MGLEPPPACVLFHGLEGGLESWRGQQFFWTQQSLLSKPGKDESEGEEERT